ATVIPIAAGTADAFGLPLGDGRYTTSPKVGYIDSCQTSFNGGGAFRNGPWIDTSAGTWDPSQKISVQGSVSWAGATYRVRVSGSKRIITTKSLPVGFTSGVFPIASSDPAYQYDRNPNSIQSDSYTLTLPRKPRVASSPSCVNMGTIGVLSD